MDLVVVALAAGALFSAYAVIYGVCFLAQNVLQFFKYVLRGD